MSPDYDLIIRGRVRRRRHRAPAPAGRRRRPRRARSRRSPISTARPRPRRSTPTGMIVAPGIVDAHTHYDPQITFDPYATMSCFHGVTTVVAGQLRLLGRAVQARGPRSSWPGIFARVENMDPIALGAIAWDEFETFPEFLASREGRLGVNFACYVGHSNLRRWVMGDGRVDARRPPTTRSPRCAAMRRRRDGGRRRGRVVVGRADAPRSRRPAGAVAHGRARASCSRSPRRRAQRARIDRVPAVRARSAASTPTDEDYLIQLGEVSGLPGRHPGSRRPQQDRRADGHLGGGRVVPRPRDRSRRARVLDADRPAVRPARS